jgi:hypothetical protein
MSWPGRVAAAADRAAVRLVPAARRDWAEAVLAEAYEVPSGWPRLAWRASGARLIAREAMVVRRIGVLVLFAAAAGAAAWAAWPGHGGHAAVSRADIIATVLLVAGLPLLARWLLGPPDNKAARWLRAGCYAAILALMPAKAVIELFLGAVPKGGIDLHTFEVFQCPWPFTSVAAAVSNCHEVPGTSAGGPSWGGEVPVLLLTACFLAAVLALTARRVRVEPFTLAIGAGAGLVLGAVMYAWGPLGPNLKYPNRPWLHGSAADVLGPLTWILLFGAPLVAGAIAGRRCHVPDDPGQASAARAWQGFAAGVVSGGVGVVFFTVLGTGTTALLVRSAWVRGLLYHGQHLTASAIYGRELFAAQDVTGYAFLCVAFPIIGLMMGLAGAGYANATGTLPDGGRPPGPPGPTGPEPLPDPPDSGRLADARADQDRRPGAPLAAAVDADRVEQRDEPRAVAVLARAQDSGDVPTAPVCGQVDLGSEPAAGAAQGLRPPAARILVIRRRPHGASSAGQAWPTPAARSRARCHSPSVRS